MEIFINCVSAGMADITVGSAALYRAAKGLKHSVVLVQLSDNSRRSEKSD
jgi:hypothetical protein